MRWILFLTTCACLAQEAAPESLIEAGHWKRARAIVERRLRESPDDANANYLASQIRNAFGDRTSPMELAMKAARLEPKVARYHRQVAEVNGVMAQHAGMFQQVLLARRFRKELDTALALDSSDVQAHRDLLEFYVLAPGMLGGDMNQAEAVARQIAALSPMEGYLAAARIAEVRKNPAQTRAMLRQASEVRPPSYKAQMVLAQYEIAPGHRDDAAAEAAARTALAIDPGRVGAYAILAAVTAGKSDWKALDETLAASTREAPDDRTPYYRAAERLLEAGREPGRAEQYLTTYLGQDPEGNAPTIADANWQLGRALWAQGRTTDAVRAWKTAVKLDPESPATRELKQHRNTDKTSTSNSTKTRGEN